MLAAGCWLLAVENRWRGSREASWKAPTVVQERDDGAYTREAGVRTEKWVVCLEV